LFLGINEPATEFGEGNFHAKVQVFDATPSPEVSAIKITQELLQQVPRRIGDEKGDPGDMVNFIVIGPQESLKRLTRTADGCWPTRIKSRPSFTRLPQRWTKMPISQCQ